MDFKLELIPVPVSDVDRAKAFYEQAGFAVDNDVTVKEGLRFVQLTPPGSACSVSIGEGITEMERPLAVALRENDNLLRRRRVGRTAAIAPHAGTRAADQARGSAIASAVASSRDG